jgi:hypothetical protein
LNVLLERTAGETFLYRRLTPPKLFRCGKFRRGAGALASTDVKAKVKRQRAKEGRPAARRSSPAEARALLSVSVAIALSLATVLPRTRF